MVMHVGCSQSMWMSVSSVTDLGASLGQMSVIAQGTAVVGEDIIQAFGTMDVGMLMILAFLICREHLLWILSLAHRTDTDVGGLGISRSGVFNMKICPLAI